VEEGCDAFDAPQKVMPTVPFPILRPSLFLYCCNYYLLSPCTSIAPTCAANTNMFLPFDTTLGKYWLVDAK
jgi:hypothetical protein